jgi:hypothetical protein
VGEGEKLVIVEADGEIAIVQMYMAGRAAGDHVVFLLAVRE